METIKKKKNHSLKFIHIEVKKQETIALVNPPNA